MENRFNFGTAILGSPALEKKLYCVNKEFFCFGFNVDIWKFVLVVSKASTSHTEKDRS